MPDGETDPPPENLNIEVGFQLPCLVNNWVTKYKVIIYVLLDSVGEETLPRGPDSVIHGREQVREIDLSAEAVNGGEA